MLLTGTANRTFQHADYMQKLFRLNLSKAHVTLCGRFKRSKNYDFRKCLLWCSRIHTSLNLDLNVPFGSMKPRYFKRSKSACLFIFLNGSNKRSGRAYFAQTMIHIFHLP